MIKKLPKHTQEFIESYKSLELGGKFIVCPYFRNHNKQKDLRSMVGKGTPYEIIIEAKIWEKLKGVDFYKMNELDIRNFLIDRGLGIDCSGFVAHTINHFYKNETGKSIWGKLIPEKIGSLKILTPLFYWLKPVQNLGVTSITSDKNSFKVNINEVQPGDVIRTTWKKNNSYHILLIDAVIRNKTGQVEFINYVNSTPHYGDNNGIRHSSIKITDVKKPLHEQEWLDVDEFNVNFTLEGYMKDTKNNGIRRIKVLAPLTNDC